MNVSEQRIEAHRRHAEESTGPPTAEGKARSSPNAYMHGLTATLPEVGPEAEAAHAERLAACRATYAPRDDYETWLVDELAGVTLKLGRIGVMEDQVRTIAAFRAQTDLWDQDHRLAAEWIAVRLERQPALVVAQLQQSPHGCDWLIDRWAILAQRAETVGWTDADTKAAYNLMGTPELGRTGPIVPRVDADGQVVDADLSPAQLARNEIARLREHRELVAEVDDANRARVEVGWHDLPNRDAVLLRRYETSSRRYLTWIMNQMHAVGLIAPVRPAPPRTGAPTALAPLPPEPAKPAAPVPIQPVVPPAPVAEVTPQRNEPTFRPVGKLAAGDLSIGVPPERNEPTFRPDSNEPKPWAELYAELDAKESANRRPDLAKLAKRERKARRNRGRTRQTV